MIAFARQPRSIPCLALLKTVVDFTKPVDGGPLPLNRIAALGIPLPAMGHEPLLYLEPAGASSPWYGRLQRVPVRPPRDVIKAP